ncbi:MAG: hypothetical protein ABI394_10390 [Mycobacterium sp.]
MFGLLAAVGLAGLFGSTALAHADPATTVADSYNADGYPVPTAADIAALPDDCSGAVCLVMGDPIAGTYGGFRPYMTDWQGTQGYNVDVTQADGSTITAGSYDVQMQDFWSSLMSVSQYHYGDFVPNAAAGIDPSDLNGMGDLSGVSVYDTSYLDGAFKFLAINDPGGLSYYVTTTETATGTFTNTLVTGANASADYYQMGDAAPTFLYNSLNNGGEFPQVPDFATPPDPWAALDFNPADYLGGALAAP